MTELFGLQIETLEAMIVALGTSFVGTGTVAMIVKLALSRVTKKMTEKVTIAEQENKINSEQAKRQIQNLELLQGGLFAQIDTLQHTVDKLIESQSSTNQNVQALLDEYKARDEQIKQMIIQEFSDNDE